MPDRTARTHLVWAADRALKYFDDGDPNAAIASFIQDMGLHPRTAFIEDHPGTLGILDRGCSRGREAFKRAMLGFNVGD